MTTGERRVDVDELAALAEVLDVTPDVLLAPPDAAPAPDHAALREARELAARVKHLLAADGDPALAARQVSRALRRVQIEVEELLEEGLRAREETRRGLWAPHRIPTSPRPRPAVPTKTPRTERHYPAQDGTAANMASLALTSLYAGSAGLAPLTALVARAATDLLLTGRFMVRVHAREPKYNLWPADSVHTELSRGFTGHRRGCS
jgi:transcriptional regulator with XRE-family HTH domain